MVYSTPGFPVLHYFPEFAQINVHWINDAIQPSHPVLPVVLLTSIFPSIRVFSNGLALHIRWPNIGASASVLLISIQDWFPLGLTGLISSQSKGLSRVFQHHRWKASILQRSAFFMVQISHSYMITEKTIGLTRQTFVGKVMSLLFNTQFRFVRTFLPRSKSLTRPFPKRMRPVHPQVQEVSLSRAWRKNGFASTGGYFELISPQVTRNDSSSWFYTRASHKESSHLRGGGREPLGQNTWKEEKQLNACFLWPFRHQATSAWGDFSSSGAPLCFLTLSFWSGVPGHRSYHRDCQLYFYFPNVKNKTKKKDLFLSSSSCFSGHKSFLLALY